MAPATSGPICCAADRTKLFSTHTRIVASAAARVAAVTFRAGIADCMRAMVGLFLGQRVGILYCFAPVASKPRSPSRVHAPEPVFRPRAAAPGAAAGAAARARVHAPGSHDPGARRCAPADGDSHSRQSDRAAAHPVPAHAVRRPEWTADAGAADAEGAGAGRVHLRDPE